jgi:hypothetical protein
MGSGPRLYTEGHVALFFVLAEEFESEKKRVVVGGSWYPRSVGVVGVFWG